MAVVALGASALPASALAGRASKPVLAPAAPTLRTPITVTWKAKAPRRGARYIAHVNVRDSDSLDCIGYSLDVVLRQTRRGFTGTIKPRSGNALAQIWCPGSALVTIARTGPGNLYSGVLAGARVMIGLGAGERPPGERPGVPTKVTLLPGSTLTASAAGRPDRSTPLAGTLRGEIPARFKPNSDVETSLTTGGLTPTAFAADPLCPGTTPPAAFDLGTGSSMTLYANGTQKLDLVVAGSPSQLFGCGPAGPLAGTTTIPLTGRVGDKGLLELPLSGVATGIPLPGGSTGGLVANLVVHVDLTGRP